MGGITNNVRDYIKPSLACDPLQGEKEKKETIWEESMGKEWSYPVNLMGGGI